MNCLCSILWLLYIYFYIYEATDGYCTRPRSTEQLESENGRNMNLPQSMSENNFSDPFIFPLILVNQWRILHGVRTSLGMSWLPRSFWGGHGWPWNRSWRANDTAGKPGLFFYCLNLQVRNGHVPLPSPTTEYALPLYNFVHLHSSLGQRWNALILKIFWSVRLCSGRAVAAIWLSWLLSVTICYHIYIYIYKHIFFKYIYIYISCHHD